MVSRKKLRKTVDPYQAIMFVVPSSTVAAWQVAAAAAGLPVRVWAANVLDRACEHPGEILPVSEDSPT